MMTHPMNCAAFDERLADYLEGDLGTAQRQAVETHLASCVRCTALVRDLERIRGGAGELAVLSPSKDLWAGIAERIEAPVVPLSPRMTPTVVVRRRGVERLRLAAVAAALIAVTAGVTYTLTVSGRANRDDSIADATQPAPGSDSVPSVTTNALAPAQSAARSLAASDSAPVNRDEPDATSDARPSTQAVRSTSSTATSSREIDRLRSIFMRNRSQLDPRTAAIIEANLKVIDEAIAQSKAALAQDPASRFLNSQLNNALDKKLDLLRTAAQLPSRT